MILTGGDDAEFNALVRKLKECWEGRPQEYKAVLDRFLDGEEKRKAGAKALPASTSPPGVAAPRPPAARPQLEPSAEPSEMSPLPSACDSDHPADEDAEPPVKKKKPLSSSTGHRQPDKEKRGLPVAAAASKRRRTGQIASSEPEEQEPSDAAPSEPAAPKRRGRPKKVPVSQAEQPERPPSKRPARAVAPSAQGLEKKAASEERRSSSSSPDEGDEEESEQEVEVGPTQESTAHEGNNGVFSAEEMRQVCKRGYVVRRQALPAKLARDLHSYISSCVAPPLTAATLGSALTSAAGADKPAGRALRDLLRTYFVGNQSCLHQSCANDFGFLCALPTSAARRKEKTPHRQLYLHSSAWEAFASRLQPIMCMFPLTAGGPGTVAASSSIDVLVGSHARLPTSTRGTSALQLKAAEMRGSGFVKLHHRSKNYEGARVKTLSLLPGQALLFHPALVWSFSQHASDKDASTPSGRVSENFFAYLTLFADQRIATTVVADVPKPDSDCDDEREATSDESSID